MMRRVDFASLLISDAHRRALADAARGLRTAEDRKEYIEKHAHCWRALREAFETVSQGKCWYCETNRKRADFAIDHFRPKNRVAECIEHAGYWWLAFEVENYRLACTYCNERRVNPDSEGGKIDHFPLLQERTRSMGPTDDLALEEPELLDPISEWDPQLLRFDSDGDVNPRFPGDFDDVAHRRASTSIQLYHLKDPLLRRARADTIRKVFAHLSAAQELRKRGGTHLRAFRRLVDEMRHSISDAGEYSAAVADVLGGQIDVVLRDHDAA